MTNLLRKTLITHIKSDVAVIILQLCTTSSDDCDDLPPPPPAPPSPSENHSLPPLIILMFCALAVTLSLIFYIAIMKTYRSFRNNRRRHMSRDEIHEDFIDEDRIHHPIWLINTIGLDQSVIDSIEVFNYKKGDGLIEGTDCSICLGEFVDDETLRILPKCSHAFHVPCINTWLLSHKNCPLCRAPIIKETSNNAQIDSNSIESSTHEEIPNGVSENETNQVEIAEEINRNDEISDKKSLFVDGTSSGVRVESDLAPMRRSVSLDSFSASMVLFAVSSIGVLDQERRLGSRKLFISKKQKSIKRRGSCSSISIYSRVTKSSSFGRFSPKASSFQNRSY